MTAKTAFDTDWSTPRMISIVELRAKLMPLVGGWKWGEDAIVDLWKLGAPDPQASVCPLLPRCKELHCPHVKRVFFPGKFAAWWKEVSDRQGLELESLKVKADAKTKPRGRMY